MQVDSAQPTIIQVDLSSWGISERAIAALSKYPDKVVELQEARLLPQLPADFVPITYEIKFDSVTHLSWELDKSWRVTFERGCSSDYQPDLVEYCFDGQTVFSHVSGEIIVSRIDIMAEEKDSPLLATLPTEAS